MGEKEKAIALGHPSYVWREGQQRRLDLVRRYVPLQGARILDAGCGLGLYMSRFHAFSDQVYGVDVDAEKVAEARHAASGALVAGVDALPFAARSFDVVFSHEVLEHVQDDATAVHEAYRVLQPGGYLVIFGPNRWYPFETHGIYWRGRYHFGNIPLVNYLPDRWRARLCPHVRAYRRRELLSLLDGLAGQVVVQRVIYPGYDNIVARWPLIGKWLRRMTYALEKTWLQRFGLSHLIIFRKAGNTHEVQSV
ncbi:MAG: methyltransferase domain-containing protein [Chloroflexi bacterium]|nr:methyltransferase domain-containing protein [Chloroflexota bacterium]